MIGEALYALLLSLIPVTELVADRISPVAFREKDIFPALTYNTRGVRNLACRGGSNTKTGVLEIGVLANDTVELESLTDLLTDALANYEGVHGGYSISVEASTDDFDERVEDLSAYYKALQFDFIATKLP